MTPEHFKLRFRFGHKWSLVYQGGLHEVWCDGSHHVVTRGRQVNKEGMGTIHRVFDCDCARYREST